MLKRIVYSVSSAAIVGLGLFSFFAWNPAIEAVTPSVGTDYFSHVVEEHHQSQFKH